MISKTFQKGGIHLKAMKLSANNPIEVLPIPERVFITLSQHIGAPAIPVVKVGDEVKTGQLIAKANGFISSNIHSSVSGIVVSIEDTDDVTGYRHPAIVIDTNEDHWMENIDRTDNLITDIKYSSYEILNKIKEMGIVGMGGATFPTHLKLMIPESKTIDTLIINGAECEPMLTSDHRLMLEKTEEILVGIKILMKALNVERAILGIENNKKNAIEKFLYIINIYKGIEICVLKEKYPQGAEKQIIKAVLKRKVPTGKLPLEVGCVVSNVGTAFAVYEAVQKNKPLIERVVTLTGKTITERKNYLTRIGTPLKFIMDNNNITNVTKVVFGGPMMGKALSSFNVPVIKGTSGIIIMNEEECKPKKEQNCIRCGSCVDNCPMGIEPYLLTKLANREMIAQMEEHCISSCIECGCCAYVCPSIINQVESIRYGKSKVAESKRKQVEQ